MTDFFFESEYIQAKKQRKQVLVIYFIIFGLYLVVSVGLFLWYRTLPFKSPTIKTVKLIQHPTSIIFVVFSFIYLGIKYKRVNSYYRLTRHMLTGLSEESTGTFFEYNESLHEKDGVDVKALVFIEWNKYKDNYNERKVFVSREKTFPEFKENQLIKYITRGNMLIKYEILEEGE